MKKSSFVAMVLGVIGGLLSSIGMYMCLITEWEAFLPGVIMGGIGLLVLLVMVLIWRKMERKTPIHLNAKTVGKVIWGATGVLVLGVGMCFAMVWSNTILGTLIGVIGIVMILTLIPMIVGLKKPVVEVSQ